jgi:hypothetical protein
MTLKVGKAGLFLPARIVFHAPKVMMLIFNFALPLLLF